LLTTNSAVINYSGQFFCLWFTKNQRYCSNFWLICLVYLSVCRWRNVDNFVLIPNILFNSFVNSTTNWDLLSKIILFGNPYNFYMLFLNNSSADIHFIVITKYVIFDNLSHTTRIIFFSTTNNNLVIKFTIKYVYSLFDISFAINFLTSISILFFIL